MKIVLTIFIFTGIVLVPYFTGRKVLGYKVFVFESDDSMMCWFLGSLVDVAVFAVICIAYNIANHLI